MKANKFKVGDRIAYSAAFIRSISAHECAAMRGTIVAIRAFAHNNKEYCNIKWDDEDAIKSSMSHNIVLVKNMGIEGV